MEIYEFVRSNFFSYETSAVKPLSLILPTQSIEPFTSKQENVIAFEWLMKRMVIKGCAELWNISTLMKLHDQTASISVSHVKFLLEQYNDKRSSIYKNRLVNLLLEQRHWSTEFLLESFWWSLGGASRDTNNLKKIHTRGSPLFLLVSLIKFSSYGNATKLDLSVHTIRTEYSTCLAEFLLTLKECCHQYGFSKNKRTVGISPVKQDQDSTEPMIIVNAKVTDVTCFLFNKHETCILSSLSEITLARSHQITILKLDGFQAAIMCPSLSDPLMSLSDFTDVFANIKTIRLEFFKQRKAPHLPQINVYIVNDTEAMWNSNLHMHIVTLARDFNEFHNKFMEPTTQIVEILDCDNPVKLSKPIIIEVFAEGTIVAGFKTSDRHSMQVFLQNCYVSRKDRFVISVECIFINIDENHIFTIKDIDVQSMKSVDVLRSERQNYETFKLASNRAWITVIGEFKGIFPHDHDFADAIQNEFNSIFKWLKMVHNVQKKPFTADSPLPSDMIIQVKEFLLELSDDPFEVKLRDNYVLLVDEYHESLKRKQRLDQKIREKCSERLLLPAGMLEELYANLIRMNSEIYVQRSKKINEAGPPRTRLFAWILTDLQIMAMADPSIHGKENVTAMMREIDAESPWPEEGLDFITLWCRAVNISCSEWKFMLR